MTWLSLRLPDLVDKLPPNVQEAVQMFDARVKERFPVGTSEEGLRAELHKQGFQLSSAYHGFQDATYRRRFPFRVSWSVRWKARRGRVVDVWGAEGTRRPDR